MSKKKGQKNRHDPVIPMNLKQLFRLSPIERKAIARKIKLKSGAEVWWDDCNPEERFEGVSQIVEHRREHARVMRGVHGYEGEQEQYVPLPPEGVKSWDGVHGIPSRRES